MDLNAWPRDIRSYNAWAQMHGDQCPHGWSTFLPWHRMYLVEFEQALRDAGVPTVTRPYWDWTQSTREQIVTSPGLPLLGDGRDAERAERQGLGRDAESTRSGRGPDVLLDRQVLGRDEDQRRRRTAQNRHAAQGRQPALQRESGARRVRGRCVRGSVSHALPDQAGHRRHPRGRDLARLRRRDGHRPSRSASSRAPHNTHDARIGGQTGRAVT